MGGHKSLKLNRERAPDCRSDAQKIHLWGRIYYTYTITRDPFCKGIFLFADEDSKNKASGKAGTALNSAVGISECQPDPEA